LSAGWSNPVSLNREEHRRRSLWYFRTTEICLDQENQRASTSPWRQLAISTMLCVDTDGHWPLPMTASRTIRVLYGPENWGISVPQARENGGLVEALRARQVLQ
jgi:hypothetical protein